MDHMNADLLLTIIQYGNATDLNCLAACSKRWYYLVHQYVEELRGPELVTAGSWDQRTKQHTQASDMLRQTRSRLQGKPNLVLSFQTSQSTLDTDIAGFIPHDCIALGVQSSDIQVNHPPTQRDGTGRPTIEYSSVASVMMGRFPKAQLHPFYVHTYNDIQSTLKTLEATVSGGDSPQQDEDRSAKAVIVYACGAGARHVEDFVQGLQQKFPNCSIVGGICQEGFVSLPSKNSAIDFPDKESLSTTPVRVLKTMYRKLRGEHHEDETSQTIEGTMLGLEKEELVTLVLAESDRQQQTREDNPKNPITEVTSGIFGVVLAGHAPIRSMVSRGVSSILRTDELGKPAMHSPFTITESKLTRPTDSDYPFQQTDRAKTMPTIHFVRNFKNTETGEALSAMQLNQLRSQREIAGPAEFIGIKRPDENGFELSTIRDFTEPFNAFMVITDGSAEQDVTLQDAQVDFFTLSGQACLDDMDHTVQQLHEQTKGEQILGSIMFSCSGRGPSPHGLMPETMADATRFANVFGSVPCLGFYAGGEIGPLALAGKKSVFQSGRAAVQGFTAVFALFIVPIVDRMNFQLDDRPEYVAEFAASRLSPQVS